MAGTMNMLQDKPKVPVHLCKKGRCVVLEVGQVPHIKTPLVGMCVVLVYIHLGVTCNTCVTVPSTLAYILLLTDAVGLFAHPL